MGDGQKLSSQNSKKGASSSRVLRKILVLLSFAESNNGRKNSEPAELGKMSIIIEDPSKNTSYIEFCDS